MMASLLFVFVQHPRHDLACRVNIGSGNIDAGTKIRAESTDIGAAELLQFFSRKRFWIDGYAAFSSTEWDVSDGRFQRHPKGQGFDFVFVHLRMETNAAFIRSSGIVELDAESRVFFAVKMKLGF